MRVLILINDSVSTLSCVRREPETTRAVICRLAHAVTLPPSIHRQFPSARRHGTTISRSTAASSQFTMTDLPYQEIKKRGNSPSASYYQLISAVSVKLHSSWEPSHVHAESLRWHVEDTLRGNLLCSQSE